MEEYKTLQARLINMAVYRLFWFVFTVCFAGNVSSLPQYLRLIGQNPAGNRNEIIEEYFKFGFCYSEILSFLLLCHGISISLRQLKRIIKQRGLYRRKHPSDLRIVVDVIQHELRGAGCCLGYRLMHQKLQNEYGLTTDRETVRKVLKGLDPEGVQNRSRKRLRRRKYHSPGPNFIWHIDGYDKLKPFGFCIHGAIDGFSRRILWLEVGETNNDPRVTAQYYLDYVRNTGTVPRVVRGDAGTENVNIAGIQRFLRLGSSDSLAGPKSFMYGKSTSNQRIEAWWSILRKTNSDWWIKYFKDLRDSGLYDNSDPIQVQCLKFCFMPIIRSELNKVAQSWNLHRIRPNRHSESPPGKPDVLYFLPETVDTYDHGIRVDHDDLDLAQDLYAERLHGMGCSTSFQELAGMIMVDNKLSLPTNSLEARELYLELICHIEKL